MIGYAGVSTDDQNLNLQHDALRATGFEKVYEDRKKRGQGRSGRPIDHP